MGWNYFKNPKETHAKEELDVKQKPYKTNNAYYYFAK